MAEFNIIGLSLLIFIIALVGTSLAPTVAQQVGTASGSEGIDGTASETILSLTTLMYALLVALSVIAPTLFLIRIVM